MTSDAGHFTLELNYTSNGGADDITTTTALKTIGRYEIQWLLEHAGFKVTKVAGHMEGQLYHTFSPLIMVTARKV